jgi:hypothetical protein
MKDLQQQFNEYKYTMERVRENNQIFLFMKIFFLNSRNKMN